ncbi:high mobility group B protein 7-like isoform X1 [Prosopis cineraria]|uniref:high mobility group B protein 7-like isoform X1 n=1 Tax=Prosopis cineraria TaxID=364024 RepID=UPI002410436C|nr:high mobility group B protein 7-like isoform X1 [Prosopis cineraria]
MATLHRSRKRVSAFRRAPDGSAFEMCEGCGTSVAIALADMHECEPKRGVKRFREINVKQLMNKSFEDLNQHVPNRSPEHVSQHVTNKRFEDQPRSPFRLFMESFVKISNNGTLLEIDRKGFETWKSMTEDERQPYVLQAEKLDSAYQRALNKEVNDMIQVDDEADSAMVGKIDMFFQFCCEEPSDSSEYYSEFSDDCYTMENNQLPGRT